MFVRSCVYVWERACFRTKARARTKLFRRMLSLSSASSMMMMMMPPSSKHFRDNNGERHTQLHWMVCSHSVSYTASGKTNSNMFDVSYAAAENYPFLDFRAATGSREISAELGNWIGKRNWLVNICAVTFGRAQVGEAKTHPPPDRTIAVEPCHQEEIVL